MRYSPPYQPEIAILTNRASDGMDKIAKVAASPRPAVGIPDRGFTGNIAKNISAGDLVDFMIQKHDTYRRTPHKDIRFGKDKRTGLHSWATVSDIPEPGGKSHLIQQPTHSYSYLNWAGDIPKGQYGGGKVTVDKSGKILITDINPHEVHFTNASDKDAYRQALIRVGGKHWLYARPQHVTDADIKKPKYRNIPPEELYNYLSSLSDKAIAQPKVDGALNVIRLGKKPEMISHRLSKRTGTNIIHTERFFGGRPVLDNIPKEYKNSLLLGEVFGQKGNKVIPMQELGGLLNSTIENSLKTQKEKGIELKTMLFDVIRRNGDKLDWDKTPYSERRSILEEILPYLPKGKFVLPEQVEGKEAIKALLNRVKSKKHPLTNEGVVVHEPGKQPAKLKLFNEYDTYIRDFFPGEGKYAGKGVGGFKYSLEPDGPILGRVGTGLSDELRRDMFQNPGDYLNRVARVHSQGQFPKTKALRIPSLIALHESY